MTPEQHQLWTRIAAFELDVPNAALPFSARLARENNWSVEFTQRAIEEYKRFVFLAMCAGHPVAPSEEVDQVWHLHLTYTRSYWDELCGQTLPRPLHHSPTQGGSTEGAKFHDWYAQTLESYRQFFGEAASPDLWPNARVRFSNAQFVRVDARRHWIIGKPQGFKRAASTCSASESSSSTSKTRWGLATLALLLLMAGCDQVGQAVPVFDWNGPQFLMFYVLFTPAILLSAWIWKQSWRAPDGDVGDHELPRDPYAVALLNGGATMALQAAVAELARRREITISANGTISASGQGATATTHPLETAILQGLSTTVGQNLLVLRLISGVKGALGNLENNLRAAGFAVPKAAGLQARNATLGLALLPVLVGVIKIAIGISRGRSVEFLVILTVLAAIAALCIFWKAPFRSARGDKALQKLRERYANLRDKSSYQNVTTSAATGMVALGVGLYGLNVLDDTLLNDLNLSRLQSSSGGSNGSDSGCSGGGDSGCGGGCGGCGGGGD